jgi:hypothetical protein
MNFRVLHETRDGTATIVRCENCQEVWVQPSNDPTSSSLSAWVGSHECQPSLFAVGQ